ncbi:glycosyltransferase family 39 protein [Clostridium tarantellae]|uniref:Glycosyltransferase RgtA/B/C/D-like domain-containing protein n=1 Tax=Clostridium tarantellae TaxID=39493 RepID=A0A6I1MIR8_9CLOT|nr:glycosyltransferase family 39 protein [Clostridium tarantellae]MPQ42583.1 hypothetical protein [Clostridium tarantellae]
MKYFLEKEKKYAIGLFFIITIMFILGLLITKKYGNYFLLGDPNLLNNDDVRYLNTARILLQENKLVYHGLESSVFIMPGYPLFMVGIMKIFGTGIWGTIGIKIAQMVLQCISAYIIYLISRELFNKKVGIIAVIFTAIYLPEYVAANLILTEVLFKFLYLLLFYLSIIAIKENKTKWYIIAGIIWAATCLVRPNAAAFPLFIIIYWIVKKYKVKDMIKYASIVAVIFAIMFSPWWIRNYKLTGKFVLFTESSANPKLLGTLIRWQEPSFVDQISPEYKFKEYFRDNAYLSEEEQSKLANIILKKSFENEPIKYALWHTVGKTIELYRQPYYWKPILGVSAIEAQLEHSFYLVMGVLGILAMLITKNKKARMLLLFLVINTVTYWPFITFDRYGYPNMFCFIIGAAYIFNIILSLRKNGDEITKALV